MYTKTIEDYLKTILKIQRKKGSVHCIDIKEERCVKLPSVCKIVKSLADEGYIDYIDREVILTEKGRNIALSTDERSRVFIRLLTALGVDSTTAEQDACRLEHAVSETSYEAIKWLCNKISEEGQ